MPLIAPVDPRAIGAAQEYMAFVVARDLDTIVAALPWSQLSWSRVLDDISTAQVVVPDVLGGLRGGVSFSTLVPWRYGLRIERNGTEMWSGPITGIGRPTRDDQAGADHVVVSAVDKMGWMRKRVPYQDETFGTPTVGVDAGSMFQSVIDQGTAFDNVFQLYAPDFSTGYTLTREIVALDFEYIYDIVDQLAKSAVDWFVHGRDLVCYDQGVGWKKVDLADASLPTVDFAAELSDSYGRIIFGTFTDDAYIQRPGYDIDGWAQGNEVYLPGADNGEAGFRRYWTASDVNLTDGQLTYVDTNSLYRPQEGTPITADGVFQQRADSVLELRKNAPVIISGGSLSERAPVNISDLIPGSLWKMDLAEEGLSSLVTVQRLKRVDVEVVTDQGASIEAVRPTLIPLGTDESEGG